MARLNDTEMLIQRAAKGNSAIEAQAFDRLVAYFDDYTYLHGGNDLELIKVLYCTEHTEPFEVIADYLGSSVSRLEKRRKEFQKIFLRHYERLIKQQPKAA